MIAILPFYLLVVNVFVSGYSSLCQLPVATVFVHLCRPTVFSGSSTCPRFIFIIISKYVPSSEAPTIMPSR